MRIKIIAHYAIKKNPNIPIRNYQDTQKLIEQMITLPKQEMLSLIYEHSMSGRIQM